MEFNRKASITAVATAVVIFNLTSCKYEDGPSISLRTKTSRLTGEWEVQFIDGQGVTGDGNEFTLEFEKDGGLLYNVTYSYYGYSESYSYKGEWEWIDGKEKIEVIMDGDKMEWEVTRLTNEELEFEDEDRDKWELEKL